MIYKILQGLGLAKKDENKGLFELSAREQKKIIKKAVEESNKEQKNLVRKYNRLMMSAKECD